MVRPLVSAGRGQRRMDADRHAARYGKGGGMMMTFFAVIGAVGLSLVVLAIVAGVVLQLFDNDKDMMR